MHGYFKAVVGGPTALDRGRTWAWRGERAGRRGAGWEMGGEFYEDDGERRVKESMKLLEPAIVVVMGVIVGFIVASVMLPMLDISSIQAS